MDTVAAHFRETIAGCAGVPGLESRLAPMQEEFDDYFEIARISTREMIAQDLMDLDFPPGFLDRVALMNQRYDKLNRDLIQVVAETNEHMARAIDRMGVRIDRVRWIMNVTSIVFLGVLVLLSILVTAAIVRPVHRMSKVAQAIAGGDLGQSLDHQSNDALGELADSIRDMQAALIRDIARREKAEADLIAAQGQIIQSEKMAVLGELVAGLAHELNSPLGTLASSADVVDRSRKIIQEKCAAGTDLEEVRTDPRFQRAILALGNGIHGMGAASDRINELVTGLKAFSQLDKADFQQTDLNEGLRNTLNLVDREFPEGVELKLAGKDRTPARLPRPVESALPGPDLACCSGHRSSRHGDGKNRTDRQSGPDHGQRYRDRIRTCCPAGAIQAGLQIRHQPGAHGLGDDHLQQHRGSARRIVGRRECPGARHDLCDQPSDLVKRTARRAGACLTTLPQRDSRVGYPRRDRPSENDNQDHLLIIKHIRLTNSIYIRYLKEEFSPPV